MLLCAAAALTLGPGGSPASADPAPLGAGATPMPLGSTQVSLVQEKLRIELGLHLVDVRAEFLLKNNGEAASFAVGFPCTPAVAAGRAEPEVAGLDCRTPLQVRWQGKAVHTRLAPAGKMPASPLPAAGPTAAPASGRAGAPSAGRGDGEVPEQEEEDGGAERYRVWTMRFAAGEEQRLEIAYTTKLVNERYRNPLAGLGLLWYRLVTGAAWAGPIGQLDIEVHLPVETVIHIAPDGYQRSPGLLRWSSKDVEPATDLAISFCPPCTSGVLNAARAKGDAQLQRALAGGQLAPALLREVAGRLRRDGELFQDLARDFRHQRDARHLQGPLPGAAEVGRCAEESARLLEAAAARAEGAAGPRP